MKIVYRPEIDGLRAIAVCAVILYHAQIEIFGNQTFKGGFIGVDIFFVISGYLITSIILKELISTGSFSFKHFYERRVKRILPALLFVMMSSLPIAWIYLVPNSLLDFSKSILSSLGFGSNFYFHYSGQQYGAESGLLKPFLHTWSLSIEEQFYILYPLAFLIMFKFFRKYLIYFLIIGFFTSLGLAEWASKNHPSFNFYFLPMRVWELLAGSILAYFEITNGSRSKYKLLNLILPSFGLLLIGHSIIFFDENIFHPSFYTLSPIIGVCLIIWFSNKNEIVTNLLSSKMFVGIGLLSYSLYLWHYPIFAFARIKNFDLELNNIYLLILLTVFMSVFSYYLVEKPFRYKIKKTILLVLIIFFINIFTYTIIIKNNGAENRFNYIKEIYPSIVIDGKKLDNIRVDYFKDIKKKQKINDTKKKKVLIVGDSFGADLFISIFLNKKFYNNNDFIFLNSSIKKIENNFEEIKKYENIIFSFRWYYEGYDKISNSEIRDFIEKISQLQNKKRKIFVTSGGNHYKAMGYVTLLDNKIIKSHSKINLFNFKNFYYENRIFHSGSRENLFLKKKVVQNKMVYLNKEDYLCNSSRKECDYVDEFGNKIFYDYGHYTLEGAKFFGRKIYESNWLNFD